MTKRKDHLEWIRLQQKLKELKAQEMSLRKKLIASFADENTPGTYHQVLGLFKFTATIKRNYKVDTETLTEIWPHLSEVEKNCIKYEPKLKAKEFKALPAPTPLFNAITETPAAPALAVTTIKKETS